MSVGVLLAEELTMCTLGSFELLELCWKVWMIVFCDFNSSV